MPIFDRGNTRVVVLASVVSMSAPTTAELNAGCEVAKILTADGLQVGATTETLSRTPWYGPETVEVPTRYTTNILLRGYREPAANVTDTLWRIFRKFRERRVVVIRRGIAASTAWTAGQPVEVYRVCVGRRYNDSGGGAQTCGVPLYVVASNDDAQVG